MPTLPFGDFLEALREKGFGIGLHEYVALGKLLGRWDSTDREDIRNGLAALIARDENEVREICAEFDRFYPIGADGQVPQRSHGALEDVEREEDRTSRLVRLVRGWAPWAALLLIVATLGYFVVNREREKPIEQARVTPTPSPVSGDPRTTPTPTPILSPEPYPEPDPGTLPDVPGRINWRGVSWLAGATIVTMVLVLWAVRMRAAARQWTSDAWRNELAQLPGPFHGVLVLKDVRFRMPRADIEDAATILSRAFSADWRGNELDVLRSLRQTLKSGMQPHLIFKPRRVQEAILVLQDISQSMAMHTRKVESLIADFRRQGVVMEHWYFDGDVALPARRPFGVSVPLAELFRSRGDGPTLILSAGAGVPAALARNETDWLVALRRRARLAWVSPITDPKLWPAAMQRLPVLILPMTRSGLLHAAHALAHGEDTAARALSRLPAPKPVTAEHIQQLRRLASVVPYPTPEFLELLRQRFAPAIPESAVLYAVDAKSASTNLPFRMSDEEIRDWLHKMRTESPALEKQLREYLVKVLDDSEPQAGSAAHLRWQASRAIHLVQLAELGGGDASAAAQTLRQIYNGPLWEEVQDIVGRQSSNGADMKQLRADMKTRQKDEPPVFAARPDKAPAERFRWASPGWRAPVAATAVAAIVAGAGAFTSPFRLQADHQLGAYTLGYIPPEGPVVPGLLAVRANVPSNETPRTLQIYRDGTAWGETVTITGASAQMVGIEDDQVHVYQAREVLSSGALAVSNSIYAPSVPVVLDVRPWARVSVIATGSQSPFMVKTTPVTLDLPFGTYELRLENDGVTPDGSERIEVTRTSPRSYLFTMPGFNADEVARQLSGRRPAAARY